MNALKHEVRKDCSPNGRTSGTARHGSADEAGPGASSNMSLACAICKPGLSRSGRRCLQDSTARTCEKGKSLRRSRVALIANPRTPSMCKRSCKHCARHVQRTTTARTNYLAYFSAVQFSRPQAPAPQVNTSCLNRVCPAREARTWEPPRAPTTKPAECSKAGILQSRSHACNTLMCLQLPALRPRQQVVVLPPKQVVGVGSSSLRTCSVASPINVS